MTIGAATSKVLTVGEEQSSNQPSIMLQSQPLEEVESFPYPGSENSQFISMEQEVSVTLEKVGKVYTRFGEREWRPQHCH